MPPLQDQAVNLSHLFGEIQKLVIVGDHEKIVKAANKILHLDSSQIKAHCCKVVAFIQLGKFNEAINQIHHNKLNDFFPFEIAYCNYRLNRLDEALKALDEAKENDSRVLELKAQILYRLERYGECRSCYEEIIKNSDDDYQDERETNFGALLVGIIGENDGNAYNLPELRDNTYELCYNQACRLIAERKYSEAEKMLKRCEVLCLDQVLIDEDNEEEIDEELAIIRVQLGYCLQMQGREQEALSWYQRVLKRKPDDVALLAVAANNCVVINRTHNVFDSKKKMKIATSEAADMKLNNNQRKIVAANSVLFNVINATGSYKMYCDSLLKKYPDMTFVVALATAMGKVREAKEMEAIEGLLSYARKHKKDSLQICLYAAQIAFELNDREKILEILLETGDAKYLPGMVATIVSLYVGLNKSNEASKYLDETVDWYRNNSQHLEKFSSLEKMYREAADFHMRNEDPVAAAKCFEELLALHPDSRQVIAQLVMAYAQIKSPKAKELSDRLPPINTSGLDVEELESANWMMGLKSIRPRTANTTDSPPSTPLEQPYNKKNKKKRRGKLPKNYVDGEAPDPERWLPKYERTVFRKKRDRRAKDIIKGSQGSAITNYEQYDFSAHSSPTVTDTESVQSGQSYSSGGGKSNYKKKRRR